MKRLALLAAILAAPAGAATVSTVDQDALEVPAFALSGGKVSGGPLDGTPAEDLVQVVLAQGKTPPAPTEVRLVTGDLLRGTLGASPDGLLLQTASLGAVPLKLEQIRSLVFPERLQGAALAGLQDRLASDREGMHQDFCYLVGGDRVRFLLRSLDAKVVKGDDDGKPIQIELEKVLALSLLSTAQPPAPEGLQARLTALDGSVLVGALGDVRDGRVFLQHPLLGAVELPLGLCSLLEVLGGRLQSLSDLEPSEVKELPFLYDPARLEEATIFRWRRDRQVMDGRPLSLRGRLYAKGLGVHSYSELTYTLNGAYARFRSDVGMDDSAGGGGDAMAVVKLDGEERFRSRITGKASPFRVDLDCRGAKRLTLIVEFGAEREVLDRVAWAGASLVRVRP